MIAKITLFSISRLLIVLAAVSMTGTKAGIIPDDSLVPATQRSREIVFNTPVSQPMAIIIDRAETTPVASTSQVASSEDTSEDIKRADTASLVTDAWADYLTTQPDIITPNNVYWPKTFTGKRTLLFAHRGARTFMPAHSIGSYYMAAMLNADYIEPDLVVSKDGHIICHHDLFLSEDTDVAQHPEFASRRRKMVDLLNSKEIIRDDWFIEDFTLAELKTLRLRQLAKGVRPLYFDQNFAPITLEEFLTLVQKTSVTFGRPINIVPELKRGPHHAKLRPNNPRYFEDRVLSILSEYGYPLIPAPGVRATRKVDNHVIELGDVLLQSFDKDVIQYLRHRTALPLLYLVESRNVEALTPKGLKEMANVTTYIGLDQRFLFMEPEQVMKNDRFAFNAKHIRKMGGFIPSDRLVKAIHDHCLRVSVYTVADSHETDKDVPPVPERVVKLFEMGVDSIFTENLMEAHRLRDDYTAKLSASRYRSN
jgi:glycerophosphoryl diester phosphodiesterase